MKKLVGSFLIASILTTGLVTTPSLASASTENIKSLPKTEEVTQSNVVSKFMRIPYESVYKMEYLYDDGMFRGWLKISGWWFDSGSNEVENGWLEGTVYCYQGCNIANGIKDEIK